MNEDREKRDNKGLQTVIRIALRDENASHKRGSGRRNKYSSQHFVKYTAAQGAIWIYSEGSTPDCTVNSLNTKLLYNGTAKLVINTDSWALSKDRIEKRVPVFCRGPSHECRLFKTRIEAALRDKELNESICNEDVDRAVKDKALSMIITGLGDWALRTVQSYANAKEVWDELKHR